MLNAGPIQLEEMMDPLAPSLIALGVVWMAGLAFIHVRAVGKAKASETWPTTIGKILSSEVLVEESRDGEGSTWYNPVVAYSYSAAGRTIEGSRIRFGNVRRGSQKKAEAVLANYRPGAPVTVRYNPEKPDEAVLETQKPGPLYLVLALGGLVFIAVGLLVGAAA
jgi:hypothetical protein